MVLHLVVYGISQIENAIFIGFQIAFMNINSANITC